MDIRGKKATAYPSVSSLTGAETVLVSQNGETKKATVDDITSKVTSHWGNSTMLLAGESATVSVNSGVYLIATIQGGGYAQCNSLHVAFVSYLAGGSSAVALSSSTNVTVTAGADSITISNVGNTYGFRYMIFRLER